MEQLFEILDILEFEAGEFFAGVFGTRYRFQPEGYLQTLARKNEKTQLLTQIDKIIDTSIFSGIQKTEISEPDDVDYDELVADLARVDEFRFTDPTTARVEAIDCLKVIISSAESGHGTILSILCDALSLVGAIEIAKRGYSSAAAYLARALRVARKESYSLKEAKILQVQIFSPSESWLCLFRLWRDR